MKDIIIKIKEDVNMEFTHEEMLIKIKGETLDEQ